MKSQLSKQEWEVLLKKLSAGEIPDDEIGPAIVHLSKPLDPQRVAVAKETVLRYLGHQNSWARHEAMWFIRWAGIREENAALIKALTKDEDSDNRGYAAMCIAHLMNGTADSTSVNALKTTVLNEKEDAAVRMNAYAALIEVATKQSGSDFYIEKKNLRDIDWKWVSKLS
jgi:hypothetical protein